MTEVVQQDSTGEVAPTESDLDSGVIELGSDLEDASSEAPPAVETAQESTEPERATTPDVPDRVSLDTDLQSIPEALRPLAQQLKADYTRKTQGVANQGRELEARVRQSEDRLTERVDRLAQPNDDPFESVRSRLQPEEAGALDIMREVVQMETGSTVEQQGQQISLLTNAVKQLATHLIASGVREQNSAATQAREKYPDIDQYTAQVNALSAVPNPATGRNYSPTEAYELVRGIAQQRSTELAEGSRTTRAAAARSTTPTSPVAAESDSGVLSDAELATRLQQIGLGA